jgi:ribosomal protein L9
MAKKEFSKFFVASLKRTAQNVSPLVRRKQKLQAEIAEREEEMASIQKQLETYEAPIKEATGGYSTEDLVIRTVEVTDKMDKDGKPVKVTKWNLKYPETIIPEVIEEVSDTEVLYTEEGSVEATTEVVGHTEVSSEFVDPNFN